MRCARPPALAARAAALLSVALSPGCGISESNEVGRITDLEPSTSDDAAQSMTSTVADGGPAPADASTVRTAMREPDAAFVSQPDATADAELLALAPRSRTERETLENLILSPLLESLVLSSYVASEAVCRCDLGTEWGENPSPEEAEYIDWCRLFNRGYLYFSKTPDALRCASELESTCVETLSCMQLLNERVASCNAMTRVCGFCSYDEASAGCVLNADGCPEKLSACAQGIYCSNGAWLPEGRHCDEKYDCEDHGDEQDCDYALSP